LYTLPNSITDFVTGSETGFAVTKMFNLKEPTTYSTVPINLTGKKFILNYDIDINTSGMACSNLTRYLYL